MKASIQNRTLIVEIPLFNKPRPSTSGKTIVLATSRGPQKVPVVFGDNVIELYLGVNCFVYDEMLTPQIASLLQIDESIYV